MAILSQWTSYYSREKVTNIDGDKSSRIVVEFFTLMDTDMRYENMNEAKRRFFFFFLTNFSSKREINRKVYRKKRAELINRVHFPFSHRRRMNMLNLQKKIYDV